MIFLTYKLIFPHKSQLYFRIVLLRVQCPLVSIFFNGLRIRSHTRLIDAKSLVSEDGESDIVVVGPPVGGDGHSKGQKPDKVCCLMETMHRELELSCNPEIERIIEH